MQVIFGSRDVRDVDLRDMAIARIRFALRRLGALTPRARVQLSDLNGPRGGIDKRCALELRVDGSAPVLVTAVARDWRSALDLALARATRALLRAWQRRHAVDRTRQRVQSRVDSPWA